ncbi:hypothetical protein NDU88_008152 [Pleurodeles waltl]|uniref:Uncharacterized protein n=1 Tax=Pleurodeles waltl TaxID=8319 RepID=A0AAV7QMW9_PLEWA|nr:hypothetical protein NDU88_008152 [Pleurodeles waltl]
MRWDCCDLSGATSQYSGLLLRLSFLTNNGCYKVQPDSEFYIRSNVYPDDFSKIMKHGLRRLSKKITIDGEKVFFVGKGKKAQVIVGEELAKHIFNKGMTAPNGNEQEGTDHFYLTKKEGT